VRRATLPAPIYLLRPAVTAPLSLSLSLSCARALRSETLRRLYGTCKQGQVDNRDSRGEASMVFVTRRGSISYSGVREYLEHVTGSRFMIATGFHPASTIAFALKAESTLRARGESSENVAESVAVSLHLAQSHGRCDKRDQSSSPESRLPDRKTSVSAERCAWPCGISAARFRRKGASRNLPPCVMEARACFPRVMKVL